jgi:acyl transferase domain-containing protein/thioesterase domain-containing protein
MSNQPDAPRGEDIAIVGMAVNVPGSGDVDGFWANLRAGQSALRRRDAEALRAAGEDAARLSRPNYVPVTADLEGFDQFDAEFFGFSPKDAAILDPQHRKFLEVAWEAMEQAGHPPESLEGHVGVYAGCGMGSYFYFNLCSNPDLVEEVGQFLLRHTGNDKDFLATRVSHVFDLKGPSVNLQTACSTSLVAIHYACAALRAGEVEMALAGGVTIELPQGRGYLYRENEILSPDGECHAFDHRARGTVFGSGAGAVALRRLSDAQRDGDPIWAVIKGSAVNNDGAAKAGYLAPSVEGQVAAISQALKAAGTAAESIGLVECHGTGTYLGDPIEVAALTEAYRKETAREDFARIGSVKTNIGHLDTAAGIAGLAKAALSLHHGEMPPSLGYEAPNPAIPFAGSPFRVNDRLSPWPRGAAPRRAAVNALGVGGTNAHAILEEAPPRPASEESDWPFQLLCLSGTSPQALEANAKALAAHLRAHPEENLADVAFTLKEGRRAFDRRLVLAAESPEEAAHLLEQGDRGRVFTHRALGPAPEVTFMFPGGGAQYPAMARDLYETEPVFAEWMDRGLDHLAPRVAEDIRALWLPDPGQEAEAAARLKRPSAQLPLIALVEYALAQLWISWGVRPAALIGHSMGENVAACLAGVLPFEQMLDLVLLRGRLFDGVPAGGMLSVSASAERVEALLGPELDIAALNGPELVVVSGPRAALETLGARLTEAEIEHQPIAIDIAAHSRMLDPILAEYRDFLAGLDLQPPQLPVISNRTGRPLTAEQAQDPDYWVSQLRQRVLFGAGIAHLAEGAPRVFLEVGPGKALSALAQMAPGVAPGQVISSLRHPEQALADDLFFITTVGRLWACGVSVDWRQIWGEARRNRLRLPTYRFQRSRYFIEPGAAAPGAEAPRPTRLEQMEDWGQEPTWQPRYAEPDPALPADLAARPLTWLIFADRAGEAEATVARLRDAGHRVTTVHPGDSFAHRGRDAYSLAPEQGRAGYDALLAALKEAEALPDRIGHFWLADLESPPRPGSNLFDRNLEQGFWSLTWLAQALAELAPEAPLHITAFTRGAARVTEEALPHPEMALVQGPLGTLPREVPGVTAALVDLDIPATPAPTRRPLWGRAEEATHRPESTEAILEELLARPGNLQAARRGAHRFERAWRPLPLPATDRPAFRAGGSYLITGGFGGIGLTLASEILAAGATPILLTRQALPAPQERAAFLAGRDPADPTARRLRALARLEAQARESGGEVLVGQADVANLAQMRRLLSELRARPGGLTGVLHTAGLLDDAPLLSRSAAQIEALLAPKVQGLRVLDQLLPDGTLELMVLFSSTSTATRGAGQLDYVAANAWLDAFAEAQRGGATRVVTINWGLWAEVGMAARTLPGGGAESLPPRALKGPLLTRAEAGPGGRPHFEGELRESDWLIDQHRTGTGQALLPGTGYVALLVEAARAQGLRGALSLSDLYFLRALPLAEGERRQMRLSLASGEAGFEAELRSACTLAGRPGWQLHAQARLSPGPEAPPPALDLAAIRARCPERASAAPGRHLPAAQEGQLAFGPAWHLLRETARGAGEGLARLTLPPETPGADHELHAGLLDMATGWALDLVPGYRGDHLWVPLSYGRLVLHAPLTEELFSWVRLSEEARGRGHARFDVTLTDPEGRILLELEDLAMQRLEGGLTLSPLSPSEVLFEGGAEEAPELSPAEARLADLVRQGIRPAEGGQALRRALSTGLSRLAVSSLPLADLIAEADRPPAPARAAGQSFDRPALEGDYQAPRTETERALAEIWEGLLGVSPVGIEDSFFDLGGHSLIAVRLFAAIKRRWRQEFPISALVEAPTIAALAAKLGKEAPESAPEEVSAEAASPDRYLVPLNQCRKGATPLFIVAGMFGNVLNLRHLALPFTEERPIYGIQARGLIGEEPPHENAAEAAADYLRELRRRQPRGPYLIGGYSGGGVIAWEMAQQLREAGEEVALLALLDTPLPVRPGLSTGDKVLMKLTELRRKGPGYLAEWLRARRAWQRAQREEGPPPPADGARFNSERIAAGFLKAMAAYRLRPLEAPVALFRPPLDRHWKVTGGRWISAEKEFVLPDNGWGPFAPALQVIEVPGDHDSMVLAPNVTVLAQELREVIAQALEAADPDWQEVTAAE